MLDEEVLRSYLTTFWGYGNPCGSTWFVGMEHGGGNSKEELERRLAAWRDRGQLEFEDLAEYHAGIGETRWTGRTPRIQRTWGKLIRALLLASGRSCSREEIRRYQSKSFGRRGGPHCLLELYPLPSRNLSAWPYADWSALPELRDRDAYRKQVGEQRVERLRGLVEGYAPVAVLFYGVGFRSEWERVIDRPFTESVVPGLWQVYCGRTLCLLTPHPVAHGVKDSLFEAAGRLLGEAGATAASSTPESP
jgi:hypothetical protein